MADQVLILLEEITKLSDGHIADECPRSESEPFISVWEKACRLAKDRASTHLYDPVSGDHRQAVHATPDGMVERLEALRESLSAAHPEGRGMYGEIHEIGRALSEALTFA